MSDDETKAAFEKAVEEVDDGFIDWRADVAGVMSPMDAAAAIRAHEQAQARRIKELTEQLRAAEASEGVLKRINRELERDLQKARNDTTIARNDLHLSRRSSELLHEMITHQQEKAEFWQQRTAVVRAKKDKRIAELERERDEQKAHHELMMRAKKGELSIVRRHLAELKQRIEGAQVFTVSRRKGVGAICLAVNLAQQDPVAWDDVRIHAVPVAEAQESSEGKEARKDG